MVLAILVSTTPLAVYAQTDDTATSSEETVSGEEAATDAEDTDATGEDASEPPLTATLAVAQVVLVENVEGELIETFEPATTALPGDTLQYTAVYENVSETAIGGLVVNGPIPSSTSYLAGSENITVDAVFEVLIEEEEWQALPALKTIILEDGTEQQVEASPNDYIQLRWRLDNPIEPEDSITAVYRVRVAN